jgi:UDP-N-acetylglucosamine 1-carboxyvinyltransferase
VVSEIGVPIACGRDTIEVHCDPDTRGALRALDITTAPYPGLATDLQSPTSVLLTQANGTSRLHETIFEDRLEWLTELRRLGAHVELLDTHSASIRGPSQLRGAEVEMGDLRAGASLILGALAAEAQIERVSEGAGVSS